MHSALFLFIRLTAPTAKHDEDEEKKTAKRPPAKLSSAADAETAAMVFSRDGEDASAPPPAQEEGMLFTQSRAPPEAPTTHLQSQPASTASGLGPSNSLPALQQADTKKGDALGDYENDPKFHALLAEDSRLSADSPRAQVLEVSAAQGEEEEGAAAEPASSDPWSQIGTKYALQSVKSVANGTKKAEVFVLDDEEDGLARLAGAPVAEAPSGGSGQLWGSTAPKDDARRTSKPPSSRPTGDLGLEEMDTLEVPEPTAAATVSHAEPTLDDKIKALERDMGIEDDDPF